MQLNFIAFLLLKPRGIEHYNRFSTFPVIVYGQAFQPILGNFNPLRDSKFQISHFKLVCHRTI